MLTPAQRELRRGGIGASEIAAVAGVSPFGSPMSVWMEKTGQADEDADADAINLKTAGQYHEDAVARRYSDAHGVELRACDSLRSGRHYWMLATPDRLAEPSGEPVEIKYITWPQPGEWEREPPAHYVIQCAWQLEVCNREAMSLVAEVQGDLRVYRVERDPELAEMLIEIGGKFWRDHVLTGIAPPFDGSPACTEYLRRKYPDTNGVTVEADEATARAVEVYRSVGEHAKTVEADKAAAYQQIIAAIGDNEGLRLRDGTLVSFKRNATAGVDWKALAAELLAQQPPARAAELQALHTRRGSRVLRIHEPKPMAVLVEQSSIGKALKRRKSA